MTFYFASSSVQKLTNAFGENTYCNISNVTHLFMKESMQILGYTVKSNFKILEKDLRWCFVNVVMIWRCEIFACICLHPLIAKSIS